MICVVKMINYDNRREKMEKGKVRNMSGHNSGGTIADGQGRAINFDNSNIVGKDRSSLKTGEGQS